MLLRENYGVHKKFEYSCTTTNFVLCNYTIIGLKIMLLHSITVITNYNSKQKQIKKITLFVYSRRATHDSRHTWHGEEFRDIFCTPNFFRIRSILSPLGTIENLRENTASRKKMLITGLFIPRKRLN